MFGKKREIIKNIFKLYDTAKQLKQLQLWRPSSEPEFCKKLKSFEYLDVLITNEDPTKVLRQIRSKRRIQTIKNYE